MIYYILNKIKKMLSWVIPFKIIKGKTHHDLNLNNVTVNKKLISNYQEDCSYNNLHKLNKLRQRN